MYRSFSDTDQTHLINALAGDLKTVKNKQIRTIFISFLYKSDTEYGERIAKRVSVNLDVVKNISYELSRLITKCADDEKSFYHQHFQYDRKGKVMNKITVLFIILWSAISSNAMANDLDIFTAAREGDSAVILKYVQQSGDINITNTKKSILGK